MHEDAHSVQCGFNLTSCVYPVLLQDGVHVAKKPKEETEVTEEQKKVMRSQDIKYVEMKRVAEAKVSLCFL